MLLRHGASLVLRRLFHAHDGRRLAATAAASQAPTSKIPAESGALAVKLAAMADRWFGLSSPLREALLELDVSIPTQIQALSIPSLLRGDSVALGSGTGTGKTLAYALPVVHLIKEAEARGVGTRRKHPRALVLLPTRELERQVLAVFKQLAHCAKIRVVGISGGSKQGLQSTALDSAVDVVVATPGRLAMLLEQSRLSLSDVRHVIVDEVDTMMGDDQFAEELRAVMGPLRSALPALEPAAPRGAAGPELGAIAPRSDARPRRGFGSVQVVLAGASIPKRARDLVASAFPEIKFVTSSSLHFAPALVEQRFQRIDGDPESKNSALYAIIDELRAAGALEAPAAVPPSGSLNTQQQRLRARRPGSGRVMIFCNTIPSARATAHTLAEAGVSLASLHGGIPPQLREREYDAFREGLAPVLVCTDAAARGLDLPRVTHVVNYDFPLSSIDYLHRVGRTGRAGAAGVAVSFVQKGDVVLATDDYDTPCARAVLAAFPAAHALARASRFPRGSCEEALLDQEVLGHAASFVGDAVSTFSEAVAAIRLHRSGFGAETTVLLKAPL